ncbi:Rap30/74 interaction domain-containing protein [Coemansia reversa NRRL 1564]|uniref:Transcription initiation factor IIF subunit alpha n=1 Tax=Coemansia reversa (strain ATCC 12441 / NRRL 1564) TaxID=763665 RepID=A0A2G5B3C4_COERN|nr:Rap30/74 interaction domain-containing protein [Coemansia reversa NRRL 1564]|eukprot:PIA13522.1 Rap30/74 interaction domain-containing protein [Coemansia reversa NRRL 1564]
MRRRNREYYRLKNKKRNEERQTQAELQQQTDDQKQNSDNKMDIEVPDKDERPKADMNLIADVGGARRNKRNLFKKRTKQVFFANEDKRRLDIEEARPWVLEDDDEKEVWTGSLEGGQNSAFVLFVLADDGFKVVPVDRWYKFTPKLKYKTLTLDEAEEELQRLQKSHATHDRWLMHRRNPQNGEEADGAAAGAGASEKDVDGMGGQRQQPSLVEYEVDDLASDVDEDGEGGGSRKKQSSSNKHGGMEEIEFEMEFDDDEELGDVRFEFNEEEENEKKERMGKDHSAMFGSDDEAEEEAAGRSHSSKELDKDAKAVRKLMRKREGNNEYESDREENPYLSESDFATDESDEESEAAKQEQEQQQQQTEKPSDTPDAGAQQKKEQQSPRSGATANTGAAAVASGSSSSAKKRKRLSAAPHQHHQHHGTKASGALASGSAGSASQGGSEPRKHLKTSGSSSKSAASSTLITKQDIVDLIRNGVSTTKELIGHVRKKLKANPENKSRIQAILKEVATFKNNQLALKKP